MDTIDKPTALIMAELLRASGVRRVVLSPGTRSAPLAVAFARSGYYSISVVIDERSAAFVALGMALRLGHPVALVCTSGSAMLNYAPALAEAYYRRVPLIAITADRPADLIDQRDSQTIRQSGALDAFVRLSVDIADDNSDRYLRFANRLINDALNAATGPIPGPVHINMQFDAPLTVMAPRRHDLPVRRIPVVRPRAVYELRNIMLSIPPTARVLVVAGDMHPLHTLSEVLKSLSDRVVVLAEAQANLGVGFNIFASHPDLISLPAPDIVVSMGGSLVSARIKAYLRGLPELRHISLGPDDCLVDTFFSLSETIDCQAVDFFKALSARLDPQPDFCAAWKRTFSLAGADADNPVVRILQRVVDGIHIADFHFSNGSAARYAQLLAFREGQRVDCNRGVSGIDGCTSTAIGAAIVAQNPTVLITGDLSAAYDIGALAIDGIPPTFKMVVLDNAGGDIFRAIKATGILPECERLFAATPRLPLRALAEAYGFDFFELPATDVESEALRSFLDGRDRPAMLRLVLDKGDAKSVM